MTFTRPPLLVVAGGDERRRHAEGELSRPKRIDEAVVSILRAAAVKGLEVVMPYDRLFGPLAALVMSEYREPPEAEAPTQSDAKESTASLRFLAKPRRQDVTLRALLSAHGALSQADLAFNDETPLVGAVFLGGGRTVKRTLEQVGRRSKAIPLFSIRYCSTIEHQRLRFIDVELADSLAGAQKRRRTEAEEMSDGDDTSFVPIALYAQRIVAALVG